MATSYPLFYNSIVTDNVGDRPYDADSFSLWLAKFFTTGVFAGEFAVTEVSGMNVTISGGYVNINGKVMIFDDKTFEFDQASTNADRYDNIVIERNDTDRQFYFKVVKGTPDSPAPSPTRTSGKYQLVVARVRVRKGATAIRRSDVEDTRAYKSICGIVAGTVEEMDFEAFTAQFEAYFDEFKTDNMDAFETWFETIQGILDEDVAGNLQNEIDNDVVKRSDPTFTINPLGRNHPDGELFNIAFNEFNWLDAFHTTPEAADGAYLLFLLSYIVQKLYEHEEVKTVCVAKNNLTVPGKTSSGIGTLEIDFAGDYDTEKYYLWNVECTLNNAKLPYMSASSGGFTNISTIGGSKAIISNNASAWVNYAGYFTLTLKRRS